MKDCGLIKSLYHIINIKDHGLIKIDENSHVSEIVGVFSILISNFELEL